MHFRARWYRARQGIAVLLGAVVIASCFGDRSISPVESTRRIAPGARKSTMPDPCIITATISNGTLWTSNNYGETKCGVRWNLSVPALPANHNGLFWQDFVGSTSTTNTWDKFDTCCSGSANYQNGPLLIDFLPSVQSVTVTTWGYLAPTPGGPAGLYMAAVNAQNDTIARATTDGVTFPTFTAGGNATIARVIVFPIKNGPVNLSGEQPVVPASYQVEFVPANCPPSGDSFVSNADGKTYQPLDDTDIRKAIDAAMAASNPNGQVGTRKERGGAIWLMQDGSLKAVPVDDPNATECTYNPGTALIMASQPAGGVSVIATYHTHPQYDGEKAYGCPTSVGKNGTIQEWSQQPGDQKPLPEVKPNNKNDGGGSPADWDHTSSGYPEYTYAKNGTVYRLDPNTPEANRKNNPNKWTLKGTAQGCPVRLP